jgi:hypothetical protein
MITVWNDRRLTVSIIPEELNIRRGTVRIICTDNFEMKKMRICSRMVPKNFTIDQVHQRKEASANRSQEIEEDEEH